MKRTLFFYTLFLGAILAQSRSLPADTTVVTNHKTTIKGKRIEYRATTGTQPVWNENGNPIASVHYTYYERTNIKKNASRPILISFNGGPGSGSCTRHASKLQSRPRIEGAVRVRLLARRHVRSR